MSSLRTVEKRYFEDLFGMDEGYVLDFTNSSFAELFQETVGKDIYSDEYSYKGDSKANRLRAFWEIESDSVVGKVLSEMLDYWKYLTLMDGGERDPIYAECRQIVEKLLGKEVGEQETRFLEQDFGEASMSELPIDSKLIPVLEDRMAEANRCFQANAPLAVVFLCGSILEGILLGLAFQQPGKFEKAANSPKDKSGEVKPLEEWSLSQLIDVAYELGLLTLDIHKLSHGLRDFRNYIHPFKQMESGFKPNKHTAEICLQVLKAAIACSCGERE